MRGAHDLGGRPDRERRAGARHQHDPVGEGQDALEPVLGDEHRQAEVVDEARQRVEDLLGRGRIEGGRRLVEDQHARRRGQHGADRHPLLLPAGERAQRPVPQLVKSEKVDRVLDAPAHGLGRDTEVLHGVRQLVLHPLGDEAGQRVLADVAHDIGQLAGPVLPSGPPVDRHGATERAPAEMRHEPVDAPQQRRLAGPGLAHDHAELPLGDLEADVGRAWGAPRPCSGRRPRRSGSCDRCVRARRRAGATTARRTGAMKAGTVATRIPATGSNGSGGTANGTKETVTPGTASALARAIDADRGEPGAEDRPLLRTPPVRPITRPLHPAATDREARPRRARRRPRRSAGPTRRASPRRSRRRARWPPAGAPTPMAPAASAWRRAGRLVPSPVAAGVHGRSQLERPVQRSLQHRHGDAAQAAQTFRRDATQAPGLPHGSDRSRSARE